MTTSATLSKYHPEIVLAAANMGTMKLHETEPTHGMYAGVLSFLPPHEGSQGAIKVGKTIFHRIDNGWRISFENKADITLPAGADLSVHVVDTNQAIVNQLFRP